MTKRDTFKYDFVNKKGKIIHSGITNDLTRRESEHKRELNQTGHISQVGRATTRDAAQKWEKTKQKSLKGR